MTGQEKIVGSRLEDLRDIIQLVENKERVGVCIDTCHSFAGGYDLRTEEAFNEFWKLFEDTIGYEYLLGIHLNDSKYPLNAKRDVHQNLGLGFLGLEPFRLIVNMPELANIPLILETPPEESEETKRSRKDDIEVLHWLIGRKSDDPEYVKLAQELQDLGAKERKACQAQIDKRDAKATKSGKGGAGSKKRKRAKKESDDDSNSE